MNVFAKFDEIPSMILEVIKETKRYGHPVGRSFIRTVNVKTAYPGTNTVCGGIVIKETKCYGHTVGRGYKDLHISQNF